MEAIEALMYAMKALVNTQKTSFTSIRNNKYVILAI
jgi:hypothetical protein